MRILVLGEGPNDLGHIAADGTLLQPGTIPILVERLIKDVAPGLVIELEAMFWRDLRAHRGTGFDRKLELAYGLYGRRLSGIVGAVDRDGAKNRSRAQQLDAGAQALAELGFPVAVGLSVETIEATLLADEDALRHALGDDSIDCQPDPESLLSRDEASDRNSKGRLRRLILDSPAGANSNDFSMHYAEIARRGDLTLLERRCPSGFGVFARSVREFAQRLPSWGNT
ncbi:MAG: hypothetical protein B7Z73_12430 [Planctomycetia bacterium 21-64-5]|nr:MAG: hypothetical protein B7Z73_12430 [Planctomycetia bacterium 21-64-5]HQU43758.1 hypothetical protein [Pirellulales bacterium]